MGAIWLVPLALAGLGGEPQGDDPGRFVARPPQTLSKKQAWLDEKAMRPDVRVDDAALARAFKKARAETNVATATTPGERARPVTTLFNIWTREALPILPGVSIEPRWNLFLRDHYTNQTTAMDVRLVSVLERAARKFGAKRIEVVSGYRSPKYNLTLRKKGHEVARTSQHCEGHAVDFRIRGVETKTLLKFVKSLHQGGVGYYPHSRFVHCDTGPARFWRGT